MSEDNKRLFKYLGILFIAVLLTYKLPHDSYSIIQYIIPPIRYNGGATHLAGLVPLVLIIIGIKGLFSLKKFVGVNKFSVFLLVVIIIMPIMNWTLDVTRTNYHWLRKDGLNAVDIEAPRISLSSFDEELKINVIMELIDYSRSRNEFKIRLYLPKSLAEHIGKEFLELENVYRTHGNRGKSSVYEQIVIELDNKHSRGYIYDVDWHWEDVEYELYNEDEVIRIIDHGL